MKGLLTDPTFMAGMGILGASQKSRNPVNPWQGGLIGLSQAGQAQQLEQENAMRAQEMQMKQQQQQMALAEIQRRKAEHDKQIAYIANLPPEQKALAMADPASFIKAQINETTDASGEGVGKINAGNYTPASVQAFNESVKAGAPNYSLLEESQSYSPNYQAVPTANGIVAFDTRNPDNTRTIGVTRSADDPKLQGTLAAAKARGTETGKVQAQAEAQLPSAKVTVDRVREQIQSLKEHPGLKDSVGGMLKANIPAIPGSDKANFLARFEQVQGGAFLQARQDLKGGGDISDNESARAESAYGRMQRSQSEDEFKIALDDFLSAVEDGYRVLEQQAGVASVPRNDISEIFRKYPGIERPGAER